MVKKIGYILTRSKSKRHPPPSTKEKVVASPQREIPKSPSDGRFKHLKSKFFMNRNKPKGQDETGCVQPIFGTFSFAKSSAETKGTERSQRKSIFAKSQKEDVYNDLLMTHTAPHCGADSTVFTGWTGDDRTEYTDETGWVDGDCSWGIDDDWEDDSDDGSGQGGCNGCQTSQCGFTDSIHESLLSFGGVCSGKDEERESKGTKRKKGSKSQKR
eukprot:scaffold13584_cov184-Alexandrium_tamarense.AAC.13